MHYFDIFFQELLNCTGQLEADFLKRKEKKFDFWPTLFNIIPILVLSAVILAGPYFLIDSIVNYIDIYSLTYRPLSWQNHLGYYIYSYPIYMVFIYSRAYPFKQEIGPRFILENVFLLLKAVITFSFLYSIAYCFLYGGTRAFDEDAFLYLLVLGASFQISIFLDLKLRHNRVSRYLNDHTCAKYLISKVPYEKFSVNVRSYQEFSYLSLGLDRTSLYGIPKTHNTNLEIALLALEKSCAASKAALSGAHALGFSFVDFDKFDASKVEAAFNWIDKDLRRSERFRLALDLLALSVEKNVVGYRDWSIENTATRWNREGDESKLEEIIGHTKKLIEKDIEQAN